MGPNLIVEGTELGIHMPLVPIVGKQGPVGSEGVPNVVLPSPDLDSTRVVLVANTAYSGFQLV